MALTGSIMALDENGSSDKKPFPAVTSSGAEIVCGENGAKGVINGGGNESQHLAKAGVLRAKTCAIL